MKLSRFINDNTEEILKEWESFARTRFPVAKAMSDLALRDHVGQILAAAANDIDTAQSKGQQEEKSKGNAPDDPHSAASQHGTLRHGSGFTLVQLVAEFRALRATVIRLWQAQVTQYNAETTNDMVRFNESIDQALAESTETFSLRTTRTRDTFLGILGHDLRTPLATVSLAGDYLVRAGPHAERFAEIGAQVQRATLHMSGMVNDLLEYARAQLGDGVPIMRETADLRAVCEAALHDARAAYPKCLFDFEASGDLSGSIDGARLQQVVTNLLTNAAQYGAKDHPVKLLVKGDADTLIVQVENRGLPIPAESLQAIFNPMVQLADEGQREGRPSTSLGLGLFIAREITEAHGGKITASSEPSGTVFTVQIPKKAPEKSQPSGALLLKA
jgi:signal transduction histidine kinase